MYLHLQKPISASSVIFAIATLSAACSAISEPECQISQDCPEGMFCKLSQCSSLGDSPFDEALLGVEGTQPDAGHLDDGGPPHPCPDAPGASMENLVLNEFLVSVPTGPDGDSNKDGERHFHDDEFIEILNTSDETIDMTDVAIFNDETRRFSFSPSCLEPKHAAVVFGGIEAGSELPDGEGYRSYTADSRFGFADGGGRVVLRDANEDAIADITYGDHPSGSLNLDADLSGQEYIPHTELSEDAALFSPGQCSNGLPFPTDCSEDEPNDHKPSPD